ncbi:hypothetical protein BHE74_00048652 [Ensete ventricosum]|nr:hypothetical protein BHE74_00048652 [Ensete ventricosum]RZR84013.1 hypothetical protein BHM03_00010743 [Ensete ventricosum]
MRHYKKTWNSPAPLDTVSGLFSFFFAISNSFVGFILDVVGDILGRDKDREKDDGDGDGLPGSNSQYKPQERSTVRHPHTTSCPLAVPQAQ